MGAERKESLCAGRGRRKDTDHRPGDRRAEARGQEPEDVAARNGPGQSVERPVEGRGMASGMGDGL